MYCKNCGKELIDGTAFCGECSTKQNITVEQSSDEQPIQRQPSYKTVTNGLQNNDRYSDNKADRPLWWALSLSFLICPLIYLLSKVFEETEYSRYSSSMILPDNMKSTLLLILCGFISLTVGLVANSKTKFHYGLYSVFIIAMLVLDLLIGISMINV